MLKEYISREQWDYQYQYHFMYFDKNDNYIGRCTLQVTEISVFINGLYVQEDQRGNNYSNIILKKVIEYSNINIKRNIQLYVRRDNFIYQTYLKLGFEKQSECNEYDLLKLKYNKRTKKYGK